MIGSNAVGDFFMRGSFIAPALHSHPFAFFQIFVMFKEVLDLRQQLRLDIGIANLGDRKYWAAGDIPLASSTSATLDRYTASGRSLSASVSFDW